MAAELLLFADFELDRGAYELRRKGRVVRLQRIPLDLLFLLVERRAQLVTREEIIERIWGKEVFLDTESSINTAVRKLRRALRDGRSAPRFIATVPARGYRFIAEVHEPLLQGDPIPDSQTAPTDNDCKTAGAHAGPTGERRRLTVLFCNLGHSSSREEQRDSEDSWEMVADYHRNAAQAIERFSGHVGQSRGNGVMAYFGWPEAHDNDAECAIRAGLAILEVRSAMNPDPEKRPKLSPRMGIDSGAVVVEGGVGKDADLFGEPPDVAEQVAAAADPGTVLITAETHRLVSGRFVVEDRGTQVLKNIDRPVQLYRVIQPSGMRGRFEAAAAAGKLTPFVGREDELRSLMNRWERALDGEGQMVLIAGEGGIGKSRVLHRFRQQIADTPHTWIEVEASALFQNTPFHPVIEMMRDMLAGRGHRPSLRAELMSPQEALNDGLAEQQILQLESALTFAGLKADEAIPLIVPLLNLPLAGKYKPSPLSPEQQRRRLLATLVEWVLGVARVQPLVIALEDLHWADPSTLELIHLLVVQGATARLLLLYTARPEFHAQWPHRAHHTLINLNRLTTGNVRSMVAQVGAGTDLSEEIIATVVERTGGVPLFVEELTRVVLERGDTKLTGHEIPVTLHDSLMARLDRLGSAKEIIQIGAVIGSEFSYELLYAIHATVEEDLQRKLQILAEAELVYVRGIPPHATYQFKHALIRDAAYEALLKSRRKDLHRLVAHTINEGFAALKETQPEVLARHWMEAGETERAIAQWSKAGKAAEKRNAFHEAQESYQRALRLLDLLPESPQRDTSELQFRQSLVSMLQMTRGWGAPETVEAAKRAGILAEKSGNLRRVIGWMAARCLQDFISGDLLDAAAQADQAVELALREGNANRLAHMYTLQLRVRNHRGDHAGAEECFKRGLPFFDDPLFRKHPNGVAISAFATASWNAWVLGRPDVACERMAQSIALINPANPHDQPWSDFHAAVLRSYMRENEQAATLAARALELCEKNNFPNEASLARGHLGIARARLGHTSEGIALIREGIAGLLKAGNRISATLVIADLAEAQHLDGAIPEALDTIEQALQLNPDELSLRPETLRLRGALHLRSGQAALAEADFRDSVSLAQRTGAKAWELRSTMSLSRLLVSQGHRDEAHTILAEIYNWFTEGFDTADLKDAKALLDELGA